MGFWSNLFETEKQRNARHASEAAAADVARLQSQVDTLNAGKKADEDAFGKAIKDYKIEDYVFNADNPALLAQKRELKQSEQDTRRQAGQNLAARGVSNSGLASRANARIGAQTAGAVAQATGNEYLRQQQEWANKEAARYGLAMQKYNVSKEMYDSAQDDYWKKLGMATNTASAAYDKSQWENASGQRVFDNVLKVANTVANFIPGAPGGGVTPAPAPANRS